MSRSRYTLLINSLIDSLIKKIGDNFRVYLERAHPAFLTTLVVLVKVAPAELEDVLRGLKGVKDVGVIGVKSEKEGELPRAYIVREDTLTEEMVHDYMKAQVSDHKQLAGGIEWIEAIPKSPAGKILRRELKEIYNQ